MPFIISANENTHYAVERPILINIIGNVANLLGISSDTQINFFGLEGKRFQEGTTLEAMGVPANNFNFNEQLEVTVDDQYDAEHLNQIVNNNAGHEPIFFDPALGVEVRPMYALCKATITFKYRALDINQATRWRQNIAMMTGAYHKVFLNEVEYDYHICADVLNLIYEVWLKREAQGGYGDTAFEYLTNHLTHRAHLISSQSGDNKAWVIKERQTEIQGYFDFTTLPEKPEREHENATVTTTFSYVFEYQKPVACQARFPLVVHNQMIDSAFIPQTDYSSIDKPQRLSWQSRAQQAFRSDIRNRAVYGYQGINLPDFDDWMPKDVLPTTVKIFSAQVAISPEDKRSLLNLNDLGDVALNPLVLEWFRSGEYAHLARDYRSIFNICVYEDAYRMVDTDYVVLPDLMVSSTRDLDIRKRYHVRLSLVTDIRYLKSTTIERIQRRPDIGLKVATAIDACIRGFLGTRADISKQVLSDVDYELLTGMKYKPQYGREHIPHFISEFLFRASVHQS